MKKGQAAMEFLMTYGWAFIVVMTVIGALVYFGVLSPNNIINNVNLDEEICEELCILLNYDNCSYYSTVTDNIECINTTIIELDNITYIFENKKTIIIKIK